MTTDENPTLDDLPTPNYEGTLHPRELETDGDNPNKMSDKAFGLLCERMQSNGWLGGPIITNTDGLIADGEHRWRAAQKINLQEVPVKQYDIDDPTRRLWRQELNKIYGEHDTKRDALEYDYLLNAGKSEEVTALTEAADEDLDELLAEIRLDAARPAHYEYDTNHNVYFMDCVEGMKEHVADDSVDAVITDPPYGMNFHGDATGNGSGRGDKWADRVKDWDGIEGDQTLEDAIALLRDTLTEITRVLREGGHAYIFCD